MDDSLQIPAQWELEPQHFSVRTEIIIGGPQRGLTDPPGNGHQWTVPPLCRWGRALPTLAAPLRERLQLLTQEC